MWRTRIHPEDTPQNRTAVFSQPGIISCIEMCDGWPHADKDESTAGHLTLARGRDLANLDAYRITKNMPQGQNKSL